MIAQLSGNVARAAGSFVIVDVHGIGYKVFVPVGVLEDLPAPGGPIQLVIHTLVREDEISLFGFRNETELQVFELLITVSGIGPRVGMALLSALPAADLGRAISGEDVRTLTRVPGVGAKTAQRMVLELKDKLAALGFEKSLERPAGASGKKATAEVSVFDDVVSALVNLGYPKNDASRAAEAARDERMKSGEPPHEFAALLRAALNRLTSAVAR